MADKRPIEERIYGLGTILDHENRSGGDECFEAAELIKDLKAEVKKWEDKEAHEAMDCYVDNE